MKKIGILDSGIGGLTLLKELMDARLNAEYFYISDSDNVPYGGKEQSFMLTQVRAMTHKLIEKKVDVIVIACNTLTAETIDKLRAEISIPIVGIEPYINYLNQNIQTTSKFALILTQATFKSVRFQTLLIEKDPLSKVDIYPLENLALYIESLKDKDFCDVEKSIQQELMGIKDKGYTHLILGCTHYPLIRKYLKDYLKIEVVDPALAVKKHLVNIIGIDNRPDFDDRFQYNSHNTDEWKITSFLKLPFLTQF